VSQTKNKLIKLLCLLLFVSALAAPFGISGVAYADGAATDHIKKQIGGDEIDESNDTGYMEEMLAEIIVAIPNFMVEVLELQDFDELIFGANSDKIMGTFDEDLWNVTSDYYNVFMEASNWLLVFAVMVWAYIIMFQGSSAQGQTLITDMAKGIIIYVFGIYLAGYIFDIVFEANAIVIELAKSGLEKTTGWSPEEFKVLTMFVMSTESVPEALLLMFIAFSVGMLNFQYAVRTVVLMFLIIIFPLCAYASVFPGSQKTLDTWFREFASQVFTQGGHALAYALFLSLLNTHSSFWILVAFLVSMPTVSGMIRMVFGAPGAGTVGGGFGLGSMLAMKALMQGVSNRGKGTKVQTDSGSNQVASSTSSESASGATATDGGTASASGGMNPLTNFLQNGGGGFNGGGQGSSFGDFAKANGGKLGLVKSGAAMALGTAARVAVNGGKSAAKGAAKAAVKGAVGGAAYIATTALTGNAGLGAAAASFAGNKIGTPLANAGGKVLGGAKHAVSYASSRAMQGFKNRMKDKPVTEVVKPPLALPAGSSSPQQLLPAPADGPSNDQLALPGSYETPLSDNSGVMVNHTSVPKMPFVDVPQPPRPDFEGGQASGYVPHVSQGTPPQPVAGRNQSSDVVKQGNSVGNNGPSQPERRQHAPAQGQGQSVPRPQGNGRQTRQANTQTQGQSVPSPQGSGRPTRVTTGSQMNTQGQGQQIPNPVGNSRPSPQSRRSPVNTQGQPRPSQQSNRPQVNTQGQASNSRGNTRPSPQSSRPMNTAQGQVQQTHQESFVNEERGFSRSSNGSGPVKPIVVEMKFDGRGFSADPNKN